MRTDTAARSGMSPTCLLRRWARRWGTSQGLPPARVRTRTAGPRIHLLAPCRLSGGGAITGPRRGGGPAATGRGAVAFDRGSNPWPQQLACLVTGPPALLCSGPTQPDRPSALPRGWGGRGTVPLEYPQQGRSRLPYYGEQPACVHPAHVPLAGRIHLVLRALVARAHCALPTVCAH